MISPSPNCSSKKKEVYINSYCELLVLDSFILADMHGWWNTICVPPVLTSWPFMWRFPMTFSNDSKGWPRMRILRLIQNVIEFFTLLSKSKEVLSNWLQYHLSFVSVTLWSTFIYAKLIKHKSPSKHCWYHYFSIICWHHYFSIDYKHVYRYMRFYRLSGTHQENTFQLTTIPPLFCVVTLWSTFISLYMFKLIKHKSPSQPCCYRYFSIGFSKKKPLFLYRL